MFLEMLSAQTLEVWLVTAEDSSFCPCWHSMAAEIQPRKPRVTWWMGILCQRCNKHCLFMYLKCSQWIAWPNHSFPANLANTCLLLGFAKIAKIWRRKRLVLCKEISRRFGNLNLKWQMSSGEYRRSRTVLISYFWKFCNNLGRNLGMNLKNFGFWFNFSIKLQKAQVNRNNTRQNSHAYRSELRLIGTMFSVPYNFYYMISISFTVPKHSTYLLWSDYALW